MRKIERELRSQGIKSLGKITAKEKQLIAEKVALSISNLKNIEVSYGKILEKLLNARMYRAQMISSIGKVNYFYKNKTIYFEKNMDVTQIDESIIHECIHYLQDKRDKKERINRMGLCSFEEYKVRGLAINEAGINYLTGKMLNQYNKNKIYMLLKQMLQITGEQIFINSLLNNNDKFEEKFMENTNTEYLYYKIQKGMDTIFDLEQIIKRLTLQGKTSRNPQIYLNKINMHKHTINKTFLELQWETYTKYFSRKIELIDSLDEIEKFKEELFNYNLWLEIGEEELKYTEFASQKLNELDKIKEELTNQKLNNSMILFGQGPFYKIMRTLKKIFSKSKDYEING